MTIYFNNNTTLKISDEIAKILNDNLIKVGGCGKWQTFSDENGVLFLMINLDTINYIN
jgi:hypothetical protein